VSTVDRNRRPGPARRLVSSKYVLVLSMALSCTATVLLCSPHSSQCGAANPAADADAAYRALVAQIWATGSPQATPARGIAWAAGAGPTHEGPGALKRDLFSPTRAAAHAAPPHAGRRPAQTDAREPRLAGVFIDGDSRRALIDGDLVSEGDRVSGYSVIEIAARWVLLEKDGATYRIPIGSKS
jgi:hypothetical protein